MEPGTGYTALRGGGALLAALVLVTAGCSSGSNKPTPSSTVATPTAARAVPPSGGATIAAQPSPSVPCVSIPEPGPPDPQAAQAAQKLIPAVLQPADLPTDLHDFSAGSATPQPLSNEMYAYGLDDASCVVMRLQRDNRLVGVRQSFARQTAPTPGAQVTTALLVDVSQFKDASGAHDGMQLTFDSAKKEAQTSPGQQATVAPITVASVGDETQAIRGDQLFTSQVTVNGKVQNVQAHQVAYIVGVRRGDLVAVMTLTAIGQNPSLEDLNALAAREDTLLRQQPQ